jgi:hypothetical protein
MKKTVFIFSLFFLTLTACDINTWNKENRDAFVEGCLEEAGEEKYREACECFLKEVMMEYTPVESGFLSDEEMDLISEACMQHM